MARVREQAIETAFELADITLHLLRDEVDDVRRNRAEHRSNEFRAQDRDPRLEVGWLDVGDESPFEPRAQTVFEDHHRPWRSIAGQHNLSARIVDGVERVEQLFL